MIGTRTRLAVLVFASLAFAGCHTGVPDPLPPLGTWDKPMRAYLSSAGTNHLVLDAPDAASDAFTIAGNPLTGAQSSLANAQGQPRTVTAFALPQALAKTYFLNLSKPITGVLYFTNDITKAAQQSAQSQYDRAEVRIECFQGGRRVAGAEYTFGTQANTGGAPMTSWIPVSFLVRPEVARLEASAGLTIHVSRVGGLADFTIGTGGDHASYIEFRYFDFDPLGGVLYREKGTLISSAAGAAISRESDETTPEVLDLERRYLAEHRDALPNGLVLLPAVTPAAHTTHEPVLGLVFLPILLLPFARRGRAAALCLALVATAASGCMGGGNDAGPASETAGPSVDPDTNETMLRLGVGRVEGIVTDNSSALIPVADADVILLPSDYFASTDGNGRFLLPNVTAGHYTFRVQASGFSSHQRPLDVVAGKTIHLDVRLTRPGLGTGDNAPHVHPGWVNDEPKVIYDEEFTPASQGDTLNNFASGPVTNNYQVSGTWYCAPGLEALVYAASGTLAGNNVHTCFLKVPLAGNEVVLAGTGLVEVNVTWSGGARPVREMGLLVTTAANDSYNSPVYLQPNTFEAFMPRPSGDAFRLAMFPHEADPGHATVTRWSYTLFTLYDEFLNPHDVPVHSIQDLRVTITIHKSKVPFEPPHLDFWRGFNTIPIFHHQQSCGQSTSPGSWPSEGCAWSGNEIAYNESSKKFEPLMHLIPSGTKTLHGTLTWEANLLVAPLAFAPSTSWGLSYRTAAEPDDPNEPVYHAATMGAVSGDSAPFTIQIGENDPDEFYQFTSRWNFYVDDRDDATNVAVAMRGLAFTIDVWASRAPATAA